MRRSKECQLDPALRPHVVDDEHAVHRQLRLWFASAWLTRAQRVAPSGVRRQPSSADATCGKIRLKLLKIGALVRRGRSGDIKFAASIRTSPNVLSNAPSREQHRPAARDSSAGAAPFHARGYVPMNPDACEQTGRISSRLDPSSRTLSFECLPQAGSSATHRQDFEKSGLALPQGNETHRIPLRDMHSSANICISCVVSRCVDATRMHLIADVKVLA